ncbi:MAG: ParB N-terminal domain-containing protein [Catenulispora sp.]|nr:ParB N-terminal domain-containing protein [Catenulispora sp.]
MARTRRTAVLDPQQAVTASEAEPTTGPVNDETGQPTEADAEQPTGQVNAEPDAGAAPVTASDSQLDDAIVIQPIPGDVLGGIRGIAAINPGKLIIGANVRTHADYADLVPVLRDRGVRAPIVAYLNSDGQPVVLEGQRRTLAAVEAGTAHVPVLIVDEPAEDVRISDQVNENDQRKALTTEDRLAAYEQLSAFGLSAAVIAKKLHTDKKTVEAGLKVARAGNTRAIVAADPDLDVKAGAIIAELAEDDEALRTRLTKAARAGTLDHEAQKVRDERTRAAFKAQLLEQLAEQKAIVVNWLTDTTVAVSELRDRHGNPVDPATHDKCPGHALYLAETGDLSEPWAARAACRDFATYGHYTKGAKLRAADLTPEQRLRVSAERKDIVESNKAWESAQTVRRAWLTEYLTRKSLSKTAARFLLASVARAGDQLTKSLNDGHPLGAELLGINGSAFLPGRSRDALADLLDKASDARAQVITLGLILGAYEQATGKHSWRTPNTDTARYLTFLAEQGYRLSNVERRAAGLPLDADQADTEPNASADADEFDDYE